MYARKLPAFIKNCTLFFTIIIYFFTNTVGAQTCIPVFKKLYGGNGNDEAKDIQYTIDKGSVIVGQTTSNTTGNYDAFVLKLDEQGAILWSNQFGGTADDQLIRVKATTDGGYISIGNSRSYGSGNKEIIVVKLNMAGNISWARHFGNNTANFNSKEIIELTDGNFVFIANENDSTVSGNGVVCRLDATGNIVWTKIFDHGNEDGFNYAIEDGANLYVSGYATIDRKDAILMQLDKASGNINYARKFVIRTGNQDEVLNIHKIQNGIAFGVKSFDPLSNTGTRLTLFKIRNDGQIFYERKIGVTSTGDNKVAWLNLITTKDSGFIYVTYDTSNTGSSRSLYVGPTGLVEWGYPLHNLNEASFFRGVDNNGSDGFLFAGYINSVATGFKNKIVVSKSNINGVIGNCNEIAYLAIDDSSHYIIENFTWNTVSSANSIVNGTFSTTAMNTGFTNNSSCSAISCINGPAIPEGCNTTFSMRYKSERPIQAWDVVKTDDGGQVIVGLNYAYNIANQALITKLKPNGDVQWSKTINNIGHTSMFKRVVKAADGHLVILGYDHLTLSNGGTVISVIMKLNSNTGAVIWSYYFMGWAHDFAPTDDGGYVICINKNYGGGSPDPYIVRLDANANLVWQREIDQFGGGPVYRSIIYEAPYIYVAADMYIANPNFIQVIKLDAATGNLLWANGYKVNGESAQLESMKKIGDTLFVAIAMHEDPDYLHPGMICLNINGAHIRSFKLANPRLSDFSFTQYSSFNEHRPYNLLKTSDNNFIVADKTLESTTHSVSLTKFTTTGQVLWSRNYPSMSDHIVTAIKETDSSLFILGTLYLNVFQNNVRQRDSYLLKTDLKGIVSNASSGICFNEVIPGATTPLTTVTTATTNIASVITNLVSMQSYTAYHHPVIVWAEMACNVPSVCNLVTVAGLTETCSLDDTVTYTIQRNTGCQLPVSWQTDPLHATIIDFTDTTVRVSYIQTGQTYIIAKLVTGCGVYNDSLFVNVRKHASSINLGPDTTICEQNTVILNAGAGYKNYLWQDGSTAEFYSVTAPGMYHVQVTDSCNNIASDTILVNAHAPVPLNIGPDRNKCNNDTLQINATAGFINYDWSPNYNINSLNAQTVIVNPAVDTSYYLRAEKTTGCFAFDTVKITVNRSPVINLGKDTSLCTGESLVLNAGLGFTDYLWNNGNTSMQITTNTTGTYSIIATDIKGCKSYDTLKILTLYSLPIVNLDDNTELCLGSSRTLNAGNFAQYRWQDGSLNSTYTINGTGIYYVDVKDLNGCKGSDTAKIFTILPLPSNFLPFDTAVCTNTSIAIQPFTIFSSYLWSTNDIAPFISVSQPGIYWLQVNDNKNCTGRDSIIVQSKQCLKGLFVPNAFTPNGDTKNDELRGFVFGNVEQFEFTIFNRYGQVVFQSKDPGTGWDGNIRGKKQNPGTYVWVCKYKITGWTEQLEKGTAVLIR